MAQQHKDALYWLCKSQDVVWIGLYLESCTNAVSQVNQVFEQYDNTTTMIIAAQRGEMELIKLLSRYKFDLKTLINHQEASKQMSAFLALCFNGDIECLDYVMNWCNKDIDCTIDVFATQIDGSNALHLAAQEEDLKMTQYLLSNVYFPAVVAPIATKQHPKDEEEKENVRKEKKKDGFTALNGTDNSEWTPLHDVAYAQCTDSVSVFVFVY